MLFVFPVSLCEPFFYRLLLQCGCAKWKYTYPPVWGVHYRDETIKVVGGGEFGAVFVEGWNYQISGTSYFAIFSSTVMSVIL